MARPTGHMGTQVVGYKNLGEMQQVMARNAIVVRKEDALDLPAITDVAVPVHLSPRERDAYDSMKQQLAAVLANGALATVPNRLAQMRSEEHTSELQSLMRISYAVFCLNKKK